MRFDEAKRRIESLIEEIKRNQKSYNDVRMVVKKHDNVYKDSILYTQGLYSLFQTQSAELLLISRYIDEDLVFYRKLREYLYLVQNYNSALALSSILSDEERNDLMKGFKQGEKGSINKIFTLILSDLEKVYNNLNKKISNLSSGIADNSVKSNKK